jgi:hypothetical protein
MAFVPTRPASIAACSAFPEVRTWTVARTLYAILGMKWETMAKNAMNIVQAR